MKKTHVGILLGVTAGIIDVIPMLLMKLSWDANLSAFSMWVVIGFLLSVIDLKLKSILKGIIVSLLVLLPNAILIGWNDPMSLLPIIIMTTILGGVLGLMIDKLTKK
jgi:hypothetical protein